MGNDESLEDYEERLQLNYKRVGCTLDPKSLNLVLLRGTREDLLDTLHLLAGGDIYQLSYEDIKTIFRNHSRAAGKKGGGRGVNPYAVPLLPIHPLKGKLEACCKTSRVRCYILLPCKWIRYISKENRRKKRGLWPIFVLDAL